ncbi:MAG: hypothetical protein ACOCXJ_02545, partial [Planctomycetota bacterium]
YTEALGWELYLFTAPDPGLPARSVRIDTTHPDAAAARHRSSSDRKDLPALFPGLDIAIDQAFDLQGPRPGDG